MLANATLNGDQGAASAMESLCERYYQPVFRTILRDSANEETARDTTQNFLVFIIKHSLFRKADRLRGKFRTYLLHALQKFLAVQHRREESRAARAGMEWIPLADETGKEVALENEAAGLEFDHEWALTIMESALRRVRMEYSEEGKPGWFDTMKLYLPGTGGERPPAYEEAAAELHITSGNLRVEVHRMRKKFREALRREVARTVSAPHEIDEELQYLRQVLTGG